MQLDMFPTEVRLHKVEPEQNRRSFYLIRVERNLFGDWALAREWGRIGWPGRRKSDPYPSAGEALDALSRLEAKKLRRGYEVPRRAF